MIFNIKGGEKNEYRTLFISLSSIKLISSKFESSDEFEYAWPRRIEGEIRWELDFTDLKSIQKQDKSKIYEIILHGNYDIDNHIPIEFLNPNEELVFKEVLESKYSFERMERQLNTDEAIQRNLLLLVGTIIFTIALYFLIGYLDTRSQMAPTSFRRGNLFVRVLQYIGQGGIIKMGLGLSLIFGIGTYQNFRKPPFIQEWLFKTS
jgi:hypothetical protein